MRFKRGDCDGNGTVEGITDALALLGFQFLGAPRPPCMAACNTDGDAGLNAIAEVINLLGFFFLGGAPPPAPFPDCGPGTAADSAIGCDTPPEACN